MYLNAREAGENENGSMWNSLRLPVPAVLRNSFLHTHTNGGLVNHFVFLWPSIHSLREQEAAVLRWCKANQMQNQIK